MFYIVYNVSRKRGFRNEHRFWWIFFSLSRYKTQTAGLEIPSKKEGRKITYYIEFKNEGGKYEDSRKIEFLVSDPFGLIKVQSRECRR